MTARAPYAFLSYSRDVEHARSAAKAVEIVRERLTQRRWSFFDWTERQDTGTVAQKVQNELTRSDLVILEASVSRPNLAFEVGFARAIGIPVVLVKRMESPELPEDYGAPEYVSYPAILEDSAGFQSFGDRLSRLLEHLEDTVLSPGHRSLRAARNEIAAGIGLALKDTASEHPILHLLAGWAGAIAQELRTGGSSSIVIDADYYPASFSALRNWQSGRVQAIADLTTEAEKFWRPEHPEELSRSVTERIFLVDWRWFFDEQDHLMDLLESLRRYSVQSGQQYKIHIGPKPAERYQPKHPLGEQVLGMDLLIIEPDVTGAYVKKRGQPRYEAVIERDVIQYGAAAEYYARVAENVVAFDPGDDALALKTRWLSSSGVGKWKTSWSERAGFLSYDYYALYDAHIRCWIPDYTQMLAECAAVVEREIVRLSQVRSQPLNILEVGYGTGGLTRALSDWIKSFNEPYEELDEAHPVESYVGIDSSQAMQNIARQRVVSDKYLQVRLLQRTAWHGLREEARYDVVCGSLILRSLLGASPTEQAVTNFFTQVERFATPGGSLVLADVFMPSDTVQHQDTLTRWRSWMIENGLDPAAAEGFLEGNPELRLAVPLPVLIEEGQRHGFTLADSRPLLRGLPFHVVAFRRA